MEELFFHMFVVTPLIRWLTSRDRQWNRKKVYPGVGLAIVALGIIAIMQFQGEDETLYDSLDVSPLASKSEIQSSYRRLSLKYHPDKNPGPAAKAHFEKIREAQEILSNDRLRRTYLRFGDFSIKGDVNETHFWDVLLVAIIHAAVPFFFGYLYTFGKGQEGSRKVFLLYLSLVFCLEIIIRFGKDSEEEFSSIPYFGQMLPFEQVKVFQSFVPIILNAVLLLGSTLHVDRESFIEQIARHILITNIEILPRIDRLIQNIRTTSARKIEGREVSSADTPVEIQSRSIGTNSGSGRSGIRYEEKDVWKEAMEAVTDTLPAGLDLTDLSTREECRDIKYMEKKGVEFKQFIAKRAVELQSSGTITFASILFIALIFLKFSGISDVSSE